MFAKPMTEKAKFKSFFNDVTQGQRAKVKTCLNNPENLKFLGMFGNVKTPGGNTYKYHSALQSTLRQAHFQIFNDLMAYFKDSGKEGIANQQIKNLFEKNPALTMIDEQEALNNAFFEFNDEIIKAFNDRKHRGLENYTWDKNIIKKIKKSYIKITQLIDSDENDVYKLWGYHLQKAYADSIMLFITLDAKSKFQPNSLNEKVKEIFQQVREAQDEIPAFITQLFCSDNIKFLDVIKKDYLLADAEIGDSFSNNNFKSWYGTSVPFNQTFIKGNGEKQNNFGNQSGTEPARLEMALSSTYVSLIGSFYGQWTKQNWKARDCGPVLDSLVIYKFSKTATQLVSDLKNNLSEDKIPSLSSSE